MFTLTQVQYIFNYAMYSFYQYSEKGRDEAVRRAAYVAAAASTKVNKEAKMAVKTRDTVLTAGLEAIVFNKDLKGDAHREAFNVQFALSLKIGLETLFGVEHISEYDKTINQPPTLPVLSVETSSFREQTPTFESKSNFSPQFFSYLLSSKHSNTELNELDKSSLSYL